MLKDNRTLTELDLRDNAVGAAGIRDLVAMLENNHTLISLKVWSRQINYANHKPIWNLLDRNRSLMEQLHQAVQNGNLPQVKSLSELGVSIVTTSGKHENHGNTPLHWAIINGHRDVAAYIIRRLQEESFPLDTLNTIGKTAEQLAKGKPALENLFSVTTVSTTSNTSTTSLKAEQFAKGLYAFEAMDDDELSFKQGDVIRILEQKGEWYKGEINDQQGWVPGNHIKLLEAEEVPIPIPAAIPIAMQQQAASATSSTRLEDSFILEFPQSLRIQRL